MAVSLDPYATEQIIERNTYDLQENLYVRVVGPYYPTGAFSVDVEVMQGVCAGVPSFLPEPAPISARSRVNRSWKTLILTDSCRASRGTQHRDHRRTRAKLSQLTGRREVAGKVIDFPDSTQVPGRGLREHPGRRKPGLPERQERGRP